MSLRLKCPHCPIPPGGFEFDDPRIPGKKFMPFRTLEDVAADVIITRLANPHIYLSSDHVFLDVESVKQEILAALNFRHPELFEGGPSSAAITIQAKDLPVTAPGACKSCGSLDYQSIYCTTGCSGKLLGYKCRGCGRTRGLGEN